MDVDPASLEIVDHPHPVLRTPASPVNEVNDAVRAVADRMLELMVEAEGIGLAAPQVGLSWRMFVTRDPENEDGGMVWINPVLEPVDPTRETDEEGCLSLPGILVNVTRPVGIRIRGLNEHGEEVEAETDEHMARVWQHENDHLDGVLIIDRMSSMDRLRNRRAIRDLERG
ncbi:MAG: peptide deformylase [Phycisphaerales bacterium]|nr:peptide deformylase [Phycisphaerales bacterium]